MAFLNGRFHEMALVAFMVIGPNLLGAKAPMRIVQLILPPNRTAPVLQLHRVRPDGRGHGGASTPPRETTLRGPAMHLCPDCARRMTPAAESPPCDEFRTPFPP
ncbi:hypothetical protein [Actinokineospora xionganensis]|uniref:Secreted protein n=1 Tax=Actinokineospora xionganensis TaxID=2684470 RepID=A0ABR7L0A6_9PSEU|nr:hypothetical protein [Actinokineospora xionganensis]MBC6445958.1 hypothetical protein [Actinokineospora xionganensis]